MKELFESLEHVDVHIGDWDLVKVIRITFGKMIEQAQKHSKRAVGKKLVKKEKRNLEKNMS